MLSDLTCSFKTRTKSTLCLPHEHSVLGHWSAACLSPADQSGETVRNAYRNYWLRSYGRPRILVVDQQRSLCSGIFAEKVESDGTRLELTPLEARGEMARQNVQARIGREITKR